MKSKYKRYKFILKKQNIVFQEIKNIVFSEKG